MTLKNMKPKLIICDGIIGSGKSFTLSNVEEHFNLHKATEPVELYTHFEGKEKRYNPLELYYENPKQNAVCLQLHIMDCLEKMVQHLPSKVVPMERYLTSVYAFTKTMQELDYISMFSAEYILQKLKDALTRAEESCTVKKVIFLDIEVGVCLKRWTSRERREEMKFTFDDMKTYLTLLRKNYLEFYTREFCSQLEIVKNNDLSFIGKLISESLGEEQQPAQI